MKLSTRSATRIRQARGVSAIEVVMIVATIALLLTLAWPWILSAREASRRNACAVNLQRLGAALNSYHDNFGRYPVAAVWSTGALDSLSLDRSRRFDLFTHTNWVQAILPFLDEARLAERFRADLPVGASENEGARNVRLPAMNCVSDPFNRSDNPFRFDPTGRQPMTFARGNYGINGGSHCFNAGPGSTAFLTGDATELVMDRNARKFRFSGNGVAGFNVAFRRDDFVNGLGTLVLVEELRAGVHSSDPRGVWSVGQVGGSVTWAHGVNGDAYGPNNQEPRSDDILNGPELHRVVGTEALHKERMPCVSYIDLNYQATARSAHPGGVNLAMVDGSTRFVSDAIDPGLWHVIHSRETPREVLSGDLNAILRDSIAVPDQEVAGTNELAADPLTPDRFENSIGMSFVAVPAGEFEMGLPDNDNSHDIPKESPPHRVRLPRPFYLGAHEVTQSQFRDVMGTVPAFHQQGTPEDLGRFPVEQVTWFAAEDFCRRLTEAPAEQAARRRYRLPTEAEWEYACRGGDSAPYAWTAQRRADDTSGDAAGIQPPLPLGPVGSFRPNAFGLYDMRGNAWEWCADWFDRDYYSRSPIENPQGPQQGYIKVVRGNCWTYVGEGCKLSYPMLPPWKSSRFVGFRVICERNP